MASRSERKIGEGRRFPFRPSPAEGPDVIRHRINAVLVDVDALIYCIARARCKELCEDDIQEVVQETRCHLWLYALPKYDAHRHSKVSTYLYKCIFNRVVSQLRTIQRRNTRLRQVDLAQVAPRAARDDSDDLQILTLSLDVLANPERYLSQIQAGVIHTVRDAAPKTTIKQMSHELGYLRANSLSTMLKRIMSILSAIDVAGVDLPSVRLETDEADRVRQPPRDV